MAENDLLQPVVQDLVQQSSRILVGQMPEITEDPPLQRIRIRPRLQHPHIVIALQQDRVQIFQTADDAVGVMSHIRGHGHRLFSVFDPVSHRLRRVVVDVEGKQGQIPHPEGLLSADHMQQLVRDRGDGSVPPERLHGPSGGVDRDMVLPHQDIQPLHMVGMLVSQHQRLDIVRLKIQGVQSLFDPAV